MLGCWPEAASVPTGGAGSELAVFPGFASSGRNPSPSFRRSLFFVGVFQKLVEGGEFCGVDFYLEVDSHAR